VLIRPLLEVSSDQVLLSFHSLASDDGAAFVGWSGAVTSTSPQVTFTMQSNLTLVATFTYTPVTATYTGLFYEDTGAQFLKSGSFTATTTTRGTYSGSRATWRKPLLRERPV
jgi:hypothetical protein